MKDSQDPHGLSRPGYRRLSSQGGPRLTGLAAGLGQVSMRWGCTTQVTLLALSSLLGGSPSSDASARPAAGVGKQG